MKIISLIFTLHICFTINAQVGTEANYLIPYNNNGKWGWCDTLGNIKIQTEYESAGFFYSKKNSNSEAYTGINGNKNLYVYSRGLKVPKEFDIIKQIVFLDENNSSNDNLYVIKTGEEKYGIFDSKSKEIILPPVYSSIISIGVKKLNILYKKKNEEFYSILNYDKSFIYNITDIVKIEIWNQYVNNFAGGVQLYKHSDSSWTRFNKDTHIIENFEEGKWDLEELYIAADKSYYSKDFDKIEKENLTNEIEPDGLIDSCDYSKHQYLMKEYGYCKLKIVRKDGKVGMITERDSIIVPFEYDNIYFNKGCGNPVYAYAKLIKDNKEGIKPFFSNYPIIKAKYDKIINLDHPNRLNWSFVVFQIELNGQKGYLGENGIEYFSIE